MHIIKNIPLKNKTDKILGFDHSRHTIFISRNFKQTKMKILQFFCNN